MALYRVSGVNSKIDEIDVDADKARSSFLTLVHFNAFGLKDLFLRNPAIVDTKLQDFLGPVDFKILKNYLYGSN